MSSISPDRKRSSIAVPPELLDGLKRIAENTPGRLAGADVGRIILEDLVFSATPGYSKSEEVFMIEKAVRRMRDQSPADDLAARITKKSKGEI